MAGTDIFLSYNREDAVRAKQFAQGLAEEGFRVWWDASLRSGEAYDQVTEQALAEAGAVVVLWSPRSAGSRWVRSEATEAQRSGKLVPAMIEACKRPIMFELIQTAELTHWQGDREDPAWRAFISDLRRLVGGESSARPEPVAANGSPASLTAGDRRRWSAPVLAAAMAAVLLLAALILWMQHVGADAPGNGRKPVEVMVMPFQAAGDGRDEVAMARGITDELIVRLRRVPGLRVISGLGTAAASDQVAEHRMEGGLRMEGAKLRVSARLLDRQERILWSENFEQEINGLFQVQEQMARSVAGALSVSLDVGIQSREYGGTSSPEAFSNYIQGRAYRYDADRSRPTSYLERAVALDPEYIRAWEELSYIYGVSLYSRITKKEAEELLAKLDHASSRALELNPALWIGHSSRAWYHIANNDLRSAAIEYRRIAELDRGDDPDLRSAQAVWATQLGQIRKANQISQSMALIDPIYRNNNAQYNEDFYLGRYDEILERSAREGRERAGAVNPMDLYWIYLMKGDIAAARKIAPRIGFAPVALFENIPDFHFDPDFLPRLPPEQLADWAERQYGYAGRRQLVASAMFASHFGYQDVALEYLELAYEKRLGYGGNHYLWYPGLAKLRKTSGFVEFLRRRGFIDIWRESGDWGDICKPGLDGEVTCI